MMSIKKVFYSQLCKINKRLSPGVHFTTSSTYKEKKIKIRNCEINYLKVGRGPHHVLCIVGMLGTIWSDFKKQIEGFDRDNFTLVCWDFPGLGKSIAPNDAEYLNNRELAYELMKALQIPKYSLLGWSHGGTSSLLLASTYPEVVNKVVAWSCCSFSFPHEIEYYKRIRDLNNWPKASKEQMIKLYGEESFKKKNDRFIAKLIEKFDTKRTSCDKISRIRCPTLLLHGGKDPILDIRHLDHLKGLIKNSRTHLYPDGGHSIHMQYADDFNRRVQEFLLEPNENYT